ncbi:MAG: hypothetical protein NVSMB9_07920 [Isosphaeraceae bacterium]
MLQPLKVYLLNVDSTSRCRLFYHEPQPDEENGDPESPATAGPRPWLESRLQTMKQGWQHSTRGPARLIKNVWEWLQRRTHPDEPLLARLRSAPSIVMHHPASLHASEVARDWQTFLLRSRRRHWPWLLANLLVAPLSILLAPLPGPNLIGYWLVYRALRHSMILVGLRRARAGKIPTDFRAVALLDQFETGQDPGTLLVELGCDPEAVETFLNRRGLSPARPVNADQSGERRHEPCG